ncbi:glycoside hydrolase 15-related protein [Beutenbergia cavernae DSM 12333]|uniref:Trehalase n=1 Tax=Beutenbergia cavernae (strain ATCC BAA-8 / DSM 12333 / CCUG 43141 / JCM 11478 / NBRC 16432 / NCIMB 13614 / HKI 0122) TaxID=471853 RepID=C5BVK8_BEUC1|nr:glycoside hydrolase family 15 protein [Beutenbergia cavernae]ACQ78448.1 glycoside hydrolase 15-related protein [Beutenbergia cavernae DSM 12333]
MAQRIEDYGLVGDLQTAALVGRDGSIDWLCVPRFDSPACFAALLGDADNGFWRIGPAGGGPCTRRRYRPDTLVLESEWDTADGTVRVIDFMPPRGEAADLVRIVEGVRGRVPVTMDLRLRFDYGSVLPWVTVGRGETTAIAGPDAAVLHTPAEVTRDDGDLRARVEVAAGERIPFVLTHHLSHLAPPRPVRAEHSLRSTEKFWTSWVGRIDYDGPWSEAVRRSVITLKALTYAPTGGIVAAATTSLPEELGGERNWDYRFCWLRDAAFTLQSMIGTGYVEEAKAWREWLLRAVAGDPADLQIMYGLDGRRRIPEYTVDWLGGYEGASPVRVGNAAADQLQLDVWGEVLDCLHVAREAGLAPSHDAWALQHALLDYLEGHWQDPDNGLWEVRGPQRPFVHSRVMAWAGVDRVVRAVEERGREGPLDQWRALRARIHDDVCTQGFDARRNTFTQFYGSEGLDAALLLIPRVGFLPWDDPRVVGTVDAVQRELTEDGFLMRYRTVDDGGVHGVDGLSGREGAFLACSFWLADALFGIGRRDEAVALFERLLALRNDVGLLSEEYDPRTGRHLGNTPQAFSHVGLVNAALHLGRELPAGTTTAPAEDVR